MFISKKKYNVLKKRVDDLEGQVKSQQEEFKNGMKNIKILGEKLGSLARIADF